VFLFFVFCYSPFFYVIWVICGWSALRLHDLSTDYADYLDKKPRNQKLETRNQHPQTRQSTVPPSGSYHLNQPSEQRGASWNIADDNVLVLCVSAGAIHAQSIQNRHSQ